MLYEVITEPVDLQIGMQATLHQQLSSVMINQFLDLAENLRVAQHIGIGMGLVSYNFV